MNGKEIERLALLAHEAATEGSTWAELLRGLKDAFRADAALIYTPDDLQSERSLFAVIGQSERTMPIVSQWADKDPWIERRLLLHMPMSAGVCQRGSDYLPDRELERTDYYNECARHIGVKRVLSLIVEGPDAEDGVPATHIGLARGPDAKDFDEHDVNALRGLEGPFRRALHAYCALSALRRQRKACAETLEALPQPVLLLAEKGHVEHANPVAERELARSQMLSFRQGRLLRIGHLSCEDLMPLLEQACAGVAQRTPIVWNEHLAVRTGLLHLVPLARHNMLCRHWPSARVIAVVQFDDPAPARELRLEQLAEQCRLTSTERVVLRLLDSGVMPAEVALHLGTRVSTVRTHIRHLLEKTGCSRTLDLLHRLRS